MIKCIVIGNLRGTCASVEMLKGYILSVKMLKGHMPVKNVSGVIVELSSCLSDTSNLNFFFENN